MGEELDALVEALGLVGCVESVPWGNWSVPWTERLVPWGDWSILGGGGLAPRGDWPVPPREVEGPKEVWGSCADAPGSRLNRVPRFRKWK
jgi:hypothetical protein